MNSQIIMEEEPKYNQIERLITINRDENILYCSASENNLYILTDKNKFLIYSNNSTKDIYIQLDIVQTITKNVSKFQTNEKSNKIWNNTNGNHVLIKTDKSLFYYNPYFKNDNNLIEINLEFKDKYYVEPYSIAFNEKIKSKEEFEILVTDYFSQIYDIKIKILKNNEIQIESFEKIFAFKTKSELKKEKLLEKNNEIKNEDDDIDYDLDFDIMDLLKFENDERIIDIKK